MLLPLIEGDVLVGDDDADRRLLAVEVTMRGSCKFIQRFPNGLKEANQVLAISLTIGKTYFSKYRGSITY